MRPRLGTGLEIVALERCRIDPKDGMRVTFRQQAS
jgi:hypothetical protein